MAIVRTTWSPRTRIGELLGEGHLDTPAGAGSLRTRDGRGLERPEHFPAGDTRAREGSLLLEGDHGVEGRLREAT